MNDFLIVGGGIAGISIAARLSNIGKVTVLEAENALGYHASGRSAAMFEESYGLPSTIALNRASRQYLSTENGGVLSPRGLLLVGKADDKTAFDQDLIAMSLDQISVSQAVAMVPVLNKNVVRHVGYHADAWDLDTNQLIQNFVREIRANGGKIALNNQVKAIIKTAHGWQVETSQDGYMAKTLVNAAGAWVDQIATMAGIRALGFTPKRRSVARIPAPGGNDVSAWPMMFGPGEKWYAKPDAGLLLVSPADEDPAEPHDAWPDDMVLAEGIARYQGVVGEPVTRLVSSWAGLRTFSPDRSLVIGTDPADSSFFWFAGQGGYGFQTSPAASRLGADLIDGRPSELDSETIAALSPSRFG